MNASTPLLPRAASGKPTVFLVDDHALFVEALVHGLTASGEFEVVGTAIGAAQARHQLASLTPDILLVDLMMPGESGLELIQHAVRNQLAKHVLACSGTSNRHAVAVAIASGARCFFAKTSSLEVLLGTLREVIKGRAPMGEFERSALREIVAGRIKSHRFSPKELEILRCLVNNECPKEIGAKVGLSVSAVYKAKTRMLAHANVKNIYLLALHLGIVSAEAAEPSGNLRAGLG